MPMRLDEGWNQIQFNLSDFTRRAYGTNYIETLRVQIHANCRIRRCVVVFYSITAHLFNYTVKCIVCCPNSIFFLFRCVTVFIFRTSCTRTPICQQSSNFFYLSQISSAAPQYVQYSDYIYFSLSSGCMCGYSTYIYNCKYFFKPDIQPIFAEVNYIYVLILNTLRFYVNVCKLQFEFSHRVHLYNIRFMNV